MITVSEAARRRIEGMLADSHVDLAVRIVTIGDFIWTCRIEPPQADDTVISWATGCVAVDKILSEYYRHTNVELDIDDSSVRGLKFVAVK